MTDYIREDLEQHLCKLNLADLLELQDSNLKLAALEDKYQVPVPDLLDYISIIVDLQCDMEYTGHISSVDDLVVAARSKLASPSRSHADSYVADDHGGFDGDYL